MLSIVKKSWMKGLDDIYEDNDDARYTVLSIHMRQLDSGI